MLRSTCLAVLLSASALAAPAFQVSVPTVDSISTSLNSFAEKGTQNLRFDPQLSVNENRGQFRTAIDFALPPNLLERKGLTLVYNSENPLNQGMGYGWSWDLPRLETNNRPSLRAAFIFENAFGETGEITATNEDLSKLLPSLTQSLEAAGVTVKDASAQSYRPLLDQQGLLFAQIHESGVGAVAWVVAHPTGQRWVLSAQGQPGAFCNLLQQCLRYEWNGSLLQKVSGSGWTVELGYSEEKQTRPQYSLVGWVYPPTGLKQVLVREATETGRLWPEWIERFLPSPLQQVISKTRLYHVESPEGYLTEVRLDGALLAHVFKARYDMPRLPAPVSRANPLSSYDHRQRYFLNTRDDKDERFTDAVKDRGTQDAYLYNDLNGDGRTDRVRFETLALKAQVDQVLAGLRNQAQVPDAGSLQNTLNQLPVPGHVEIALAEKGEGDAQWIHDPSLRLPDFIRPSVFQVEKPNANELQIRSYRNGIFFVDVNGDRRKDLLFCPGEYGLDANFVSVEGDGDTHFSPNTLLALKLFIPDLVKDRVFPDPRAYAGRAARVFVNTPDYAAWEKDWAKFSDGKAGTTRQNYLVGKSRWVETSTPGLLCNQDSLLLDYNQDGKIDILTGTKLYLNDGRGFQNPQVIEISDPQVIFAASEPIADLKDQLSFEPAPDGRLKLVQARSLETNPVTQRLDRIRSGTTESSVLPPPAKLMQTLNSPFSGHIDLEWEPREGSWVLSRLWKDPQAGQRPEVEEHRYLGRLYEAHRGLFLGFARTETDSYLLSGQERQDLRRREEAFAQDLDPSVYLFESRASLRSLPLWERLSGRSSKKEFTVLEDRRNRWQAYALSRGRIRPYVAERTERRLDPSDDQIASDSLRRFVHFDDRRWILDAQGERFLPLYQIEREEGHGLYSKHTDDLLASVSTRLTRSKYDGQKYLLVPERIELRGRDDRPERGTTAVSFDDQGLLKKACISDRCQSWDYDDQGRLIFSRNEKGFEQHYAYQGTGPLVSHITDADGTESRRYDPLSGSLLFLRNRQGGEWLYTSSADGFLQQVEARTGSDHSWEKLFDLRLSGNEVQYDLAQAPRTLTLDGFGRVLSQKEGRAFGREVLISQQVWGHGSELQQQSLPAFAGPKPTSAMLFQRDFDGHGRVLNEAQASGDKISWNYDGACSERTLNGLAQNSECRGLNGRLLSQTDQGEAFHFDINSLEEVNEVRFGQSDALVAYRRNGWGEIVESEGKDPSQNFADGFATWLKAQDISDAGTKVLRDQALSLFDGLGRLLKRDDGSEANQYQRGLLSRQQWKNLGMETSYTWNGQAELETQNVSGPGFNAGLSVDHDAAARPLHQKLSLQGQPVLQSSYDYERGELTALRPYVSRIEHDEFKKLKSITWTNGLRLAWEYYPGLERQKSLEVTSAAGLTLFTEERVDDTGRLLQSRKSQSALHPPLEESFSYDPKNRQLPLNRSVGLERDNEGRALRLGDDTLEWSNDNLRSIRGYTFHYDAKGTLVMACPVGQKPGSGCLARIDADTYLLRGTLIHRLNVEGHTVAVSIGDRVFPVVTDALHSVRAMFSPDGRELLWERHYSAWGEKKLFVNAHAHALPEKDIREIEGLTLFAFAGLIEVPGLGDVAGAPVYFSQSRAYSPAAREWLSVDPHVRWSPDELATKPGNWFPLRYANNRPLDYWDPSGRVVWKISTGFGATFCGPGVQTSVTYNVSSKDGKLEQAISVARAKGGGVSVGGSGSVQLGFDTSDGITEGESRFTSLGVVLAPLGFGLAIDVSRSTYADGSHSYSVMAGPAFGVKADAHLYYGSEVSAKPEDFQLHLPDFSNGLDAWRRDSEAVPFYLRDSSKDSL